MNHGNGNSKEILKSFYGMRGVMKWQHLFGLFKLEGEMISVFLLPLFS